MRKKLQLLFCILTLLCSIGGYLLPTNHVQTPVIVAEGSDSDPTGT
ncbi:hypothetical protein [Marininema mesophilum]|nr:hypothetical protein [Marininema mesophilum]